MTNRILTSYTTFITVAVVLAIAGTMAVHASEVTGTLSSDTISDSQTSGNIVGTVSGDSQTSGNIDGTVTSASGGNSGGSNSGNSGGGGGVRVSLSDSSSDTSTDTSSDTPAGSVLGAATNNTQTPSFPNAGVEPASGHVDQSLWLRVVTLLRNIVSF